MTYPSPAPPSSSTSSSSANVPFARQWITLPTSILGGPRMASAFVRLGGEMFLIGGEDDDEDRLDSVVSYNHTSQQWTNHPSLPQGPTDLCSASALDHRRLVVVGGYYPHEKSALLFDVETQTWSPLPEMHAGRDSPALVAVGDKLYAIGGYNPHENKCEKGVEVLEDNRDDDRAKSWKPLQQGMRMRRGGCAAVFHPESGRIIVTGGGNEDLGSNLCFHNSCEVYDTKGQSWNQTKLPPMSTARARHASVIVHDNLLVVIGGLDDSCTVTAKVEALWLDNDDDSQEEWVSLPPMNTPRVRFAAFVTPSGQGIIVMGGSDASGNVLDSMEVLPLTSPTRRTPVPKAPPLQPMPSLDQTDLKEQSEKWALDATNLKQEYNKRVKESELEIRKRHEQRRRALEAQIAQDEQECKKQINSIRATANEWNTDVDRKILLARNTAAQFVSDPPNEVHVVEGDQETDISSLTRLTLDAGRSHPPPPSQPLLLAVARRGEYSTTPKPPPSRPANQDGRRG